MPYVKQSYRNLVDSGIQDIIQSLAAVPTEDLDGVVNYVETRIAIRAFANGPPRYNQLARMVKSLTMAKAEILRRFLGQVEDSAIERNGDIPEFASYTHQTLPL